MVYTVFYVHAHVRIGMNGVMNVNGMPLVSSTYMCWDALSVDVWAGKWVVGWVV